MYNIRFCVFYDLIVIGSCPSFIPSHSRVDSLFGKWRPRKYLLRRDNVYMASVWAFWTGPSCLILNAESQKLGIYCPMFLKETTNVFKTSSSASTSGRVGNVGNESMQCWIKGRTAKQGNISNQPVHQTVTECFANFFQVKIDNTIQIGESKITA